MQNQQPIRRSHGAKAIAIDPREMLARYRLLQLLALLFGALSAFGLHLIFGH